tara:strand:- start:632 stop:1423 length:792 start_codon:yes stop_codon:yes gene_type:complete
MITTNPFSQLSESIPSIVLQLFVLAMILLIIVGTFLDILHKKNVRYFFENIKKIKKSATKTLNKSEKTSVIFKTIKNDILTTSELNGKRRLAHLLGMYGTIIFWITSLIMIFCYINASSITPSVYPVMWHIGAIMTLIGGCWFWFFLRVDVVAEAYPWYRLTIADLFVLSLLITQSSGLMWSFFQYFQFTILNNLFLVFFIISNIILFGGVYWSKFAHMFYKPGAAIQKNLSEADGSRDNLPQPADVPKKYGLGMKREEPKHY